MSSEFGFNELMVDYSLTCGIMMVNKEQDGMMDPMQYLDAFIETTETPPRAACEDFLMQFYAHNPQQVQDWLVHHKHLWEEFKREDAAQEILGALQKVMEEYTGDTRIGPVVDNFISRYCPEVRHGMELMRILADGMEEVRRGDK